MLQCRYAWVFVLYDVTVCVGYFICRLVQTQLIVSSQCSSRLRTYTNLEPNDGADGERATKRHKSASSDAPQAVVLDIEGTVAPISYVYEVMFPYAKKQLGAYLQKHWQSHELQAELQQLQAAVSSLRHGRSKSSTMGAKHALAVQSKTCSRSSHTASNAIQHTASNAIQHTASDLR